MQEEMNEAEWTEFLRAETVDATDGKGGRTVYVENKIFTETFIHAGSVGLIAKNCVFREDMSMFSYFPESDVFLTDCTFKKELLLGEIQSKKKIVFLGCSFEDSAVFSKINLSRLELNLRAAPKITFGSDSAIDHIQIGGKDRNRIGKMHLDAGIAKKRIEINHTEIEDLHVGYSTLEAEMIIANTELRKLTVDNFRNEGWLKFLNCNASGIGKSELLINQSNLGKAEFFQVDFASFNRLNITNSVLFESVFVNCSWSKTNIISQITHFSPTLNREKETQARQLAENRREVYRQIREYSTKCVSLKFS